MPIVCQRPEPLAIRRRLTDWIRGRRRPATVAGDPEAVGDGERLEKQVERRRAAALRLPPLDCGCRDPLDTRHVAAQCRYPRRGAI
jgi:hypothetical protein